MPVVIRDSPGNGSKALRNGADNVDALEDNSLFGSFGRSANSFKVCLKKMQPPIRGSAIDALRIQDAPLDSHVTMGVETIGFKSDDDVIIAARDVDRCNCL